jgi:hypothetical protein
MRHLHPPFPGELQPLRYNGCYVAGISCISPGNEYLHFGPQDMHASRTVGPVTSARFPYPTSTHVRNDGQSSLSGVFSMSFLILGGYVDCIKYGSMPLFPKICVAYIYEPRGFGSNCLFRRLHEGLSASDDLAVKKIRLRGPQNFLPDSGLAFSCHPPLPYGDEMANAPKDEGTTSELSTVAVAMNRDHMNKEVGIEDSEAQTPTSSATGNTNGDREEEYPEGGLQAWLSVFGSFCGMMCCFGMMNTIGTFQAYISTHQLKSYSPSDVGWIFSIYLFVSYLGGLQVGQIFDAIGPRVLVGLGSLFLLACMFLLDPCTSKPSMPISYIIVNGFRILALRFSLWRPGGCRNIVDINSLPCINRTLFPTTKRYGHWTCQLWRLHWRCLIPIVVAVNLRPVRFWLGNQSPRIHLSIPTQLSEHSYKVSATSKTTFSRERLARSSDVQGFDPGYYDRRRLLDRMGHVHVNYLHYFLFSVHRYAQFPRISASGHFQRGFILR